MKKAASVIATVVFAVLGYFLTTSVLSRTQPKEFRSETGAFSVTTPALLKEEVQSADFPQIGTITSHVFSGNKGNTSYAVSYTDFPEDFIQRADPERVLNGGRDGAVSNVNGKLVLETQISLGTNPGRELVIDAKAGDGRDATIKTRVYLVRNRLYQVMVVAPKGEVSNDEMMKYLGSFRLI